MDIEIKPGKVDVIILRGTIDALTAPLIGLAQVTDADEGLGHGRPQGLAAVSRAPGWS